MVGKKQEKSKPIKESMPFSQQTVIPLATESVYPEVSEIVTASTDNYEVNQPRVNLMQTEEKSSQTRNRIPLFSGEDRTIPAYIRRIEDN